MAHFESEWVGAPVGQTWFTIRLSILIILVVGGRLASFYLNDNPLEFFWQGMHIYIYIDRKRNIIKEYRRIQRKE